MDVTARRVAQPCTGLDESRQRNARMLLAVFADAAPVRDHGETVPAQLHTGSDTGAHEKPGRMQSACRKHHLACMDSLGPSVAVNVDAHDGRTVRSEERRVGKESRCGWYSEGGRVQ